MLNRNVIAVAVLAVLVFVVAGCNSAPELAPIGSRSVNAGSTLEFEILAFDPDGDSLTYSAENLPAGATFDPSTRIFSWTPDYTAWGAYNDIVFRVTDGEESDNEVIAIFVTKVEADYSDEVTEIPDDQAAEAQLVGDSVIFPADGNDDLLDILPGDIIVSGYDHGFLRRVTGTSTTAADIVFTTEQATIAELYEWAELTKTVPLQGDAAEPWINIDFSGTVIYEQTDPVPLRVSIPDGNFIIEPSLDMDLEIGGFPPEIERFYFALSGTAQFNVDLLVEAGGAVDWADSLSVPLGNLTPFTIPGTPIVVVPHLNLLLDANAGFEAEVDAEAGVSANAEIVSGVQYEFGEWSKIEEQDFAHYIHGPWIEANVNGHAYGHAMIEIKLLFFDVAGPYLQAGPYAEAWFEYLPDCYVQLDGGVDGYVGIDLDALWPNFPYDLEWDLFDLRHTLYYQTCN